MNIVLHWPQITLLAMMAVEFGIVAAKFGEQKKDRYGFAELIIAPAIMFWLLWEGGFFG